MNCREKTRHSFPMNERSCFKTSELQLAARRRWIYSGLIIDKLIAREFKSIKHPFVSRWRFKVLHMSVRASRRAVRQRWISRRRAESRGDLQRKSGYLAPRGGSVRVSARLSSWGRSQERRMMMVMLLKNHGAHSRALPVHIDEKRPSPFRAALITDSFESRHRGGGERSPRSVKVDNSSPSPARADERVWRGARRVVPEPPLCVADWRERGGAVCRQMIRARCSPHCSSAILSLSRAALHTSTQ